jgi:hypothetical protein
MKVVFIVYVISWLILLSVYISSKFKERKTKGSVTSRSGSKEPWFLYLIFVFFAPIVVLIIPFVLTKKNSSSGVPKELSGMMSQLDSVVFPDGPIQVLEELNELSEILGVPTSRIEGTYKYACTRAFLGNCDKETLIRGIKRHEIGLSDRQINLFAKFVFSKLLKQKSKIDDPAFLEATLSALGFMPDNNGGLEYDEIPGAFGSFGIESTNPVPVNGILSSNAYLSKLMTDDGLTISWERVGSMGADNIDKPIDCYKITDSKGQRRPNIYISAYHSCTSKKAPKGYKFK